MIKKPLLYEIKTGVLDKFYLLLFTAIKQALNVIELLSTRHLYVKSFP